ncbi:MAG TPA: sialidase family protein [Chthoniobacteraceae bacterium]|nr:sialidase family protein [Chthoniobacteraceae bacterium]
MNATRVLTEHDQRQMVAPASSLHRRNTEASIAPLGEEGALMLVLTRFGQSASDHSSAALHARISRDDGASWEPMFKLRDEGDALNVMAPSLVRLVSGKLALSYIQKESGHEARLFFSTSEDDGANWSEPRAMHDRGAYRVCLNDSLIQQPGTGRLLQAAYETLPPPGPESYRAHTLFSDDEGATWQRSANEVACPGRGAMEPVLMPYEKEGARRIAMFLRTDQGTIWRSESTDGGASWSRAVPTSISSPQAPCMVRHLPEQAVTLLCWNNCYQPGTGHGGPRRSLALAISRDHGETFPEIYPLEDDTLHSFAYPSLLWHRGFLHLTYYEDTGNLILGEHPDLTLSLIHRRLQPSF